MATSDFIRAHKGWLQTAFLSLRKDQREIAILATVDVAPEEYFERLSEQIKNREKRGFAIVYDFDTETDHLGDSQRAIVDALREHGFVYLRDSIAVEDYWTKAGKIDEPVEADQKAGEASDEESASKTPANAEALAASMRSGELPHPMHDLATSLANKHADGRGTHAAEVIKQQAEHYHVYAFLGANRVGGVVEGLMDAGFELNQTHWMDVMAVEQGRAEAKPTIDYRRQ